MDAGQARGRVLQRLRAPSQCAGSNCAVFTEANPAEPKNADFVDFPAFFLQENVLRRLAAFPRTTLRPWLSYGWGCGVGRGQRCGYKLPASVRVLANSCGLGAV